MNALTVVGRVHRMADFSDMGRNLCSWNDAFGPMEFYKCSLVLREAHADAATTDYRDGH